MNPERETPTVIFIPGFMQPGEAWAPVAAKLPERYPSVLLGHAADERSGRLVEIREAAHAARDPVVLCGYSLGGRLALRAAIDDPTRYAAVITVGASAGIEQPAIRRERAEADAKLAGWMETQPIEAIVEVWERQPLFVDQSEQQIEDQRPGRLAQDPRGLALLLRTAGQGTMDPMWGELSRLEMPLLALAGARDERYCELGRRLAGETPRGSFKAVEHAGHAAHLQCPEDVAAVLVAFLDEHLGENGV